MIKQILKTALLSLAIGFLFQLFQRGIDSSYLNTFLQENLINLMAGLLAINSATLGIVLTKIRELVERHGNAGVFKDSRDQMLLSIGEQVWLIFVAVISLTIGGSKNIPPDSDLKLLIDSITTASFAYAMLILYDTAKSVLIIIDFDAHNDFKDEYQS